MPECREVGQHPGEPVAARKGRGCRISAMVRKASILFGLLLAGTLATSVAIQACSSDTTGGCVTVDAGDAGTTCVPVTTSGGW